MQEVLTFDAEFEILSYNWLLKTEVKKESEGKEKTKNVARESEGREKKKKKKMR